MNKKERIKKMSIHSGEESKLTGDLKCEKCRMNVHVINGRKIPKCPNCGHDSFESSSIDH
jgi:predicted RNA-binding Zn-ribbon protein involved in translation (DUF1610 family)